MTIKSIARKIIGTPLSLLMLSVLLLACTAPRSELDTLTPELSRISAVAVTSPGFELPPNASLSWRAKVIWLQAEDIPPDRQLNESTIQRAIEKQLVEQGYSFAGSNSLADYALVAAVVLGDSVEGKALKELARIYPSLGQVSQTLDKGTLLVGISRPRSPHILWRGAVQVFLAEEASPELRTKRIESVMRSLFATLPVSKI